MEKSKIPTNIDEYISTFPVNVQKMLEEIRSTIRKVAPDAEEKISYRIPAFTLKGIIVYFGAYKNHIGFYPTSSATKAFKEELSDYKFSKGAIQFPLNKPLPLSLIKKIVDFRVKENLAKSGYK